MSVLSTAILAFAAGFLTCVAMGGAVIWWAFADERARVPSPETPVRPTTIERA
jgi:hypothetical protein